VHVAAEIQQQEVHPSKNNQHGLDLWDRVRQFDERSAVEDFTPVLTRKQKQKIKLQQVMGKQPTKTRARGDHSTKKWVGIMHAALSSGYFISYFSRR